MTAIFKPVAQPTPNAPVVVVAEDDAEIRAMVVRALGARYTVYEAVDGKAAENLLGSIPSPAALVCDIMMPGLDGLQLVRRMRRNPTLAQVPVLFLTAKSAPRDVITGINAGARHYMTKPFKIADLLAKVETMVRKRPG